jgi:hypothetical protein
MNTCRTSIAVLLLTLFFSGIAMAQNKYIGTKMCSACHKQKKAGETYKVWQKSAHANAFKTLQTEEAEKIAKEKGLKKPAAESPECLKCHVTGGGTAENVDKSFKMTEGVTCEACHGPGSGYKTLHSKPANREKAIAKGLVIGDKSDSKPCVTCHNEESPTYKEFNMSAMWKKIAHQLPSKEEK